MNKRTIKTAAGTRTFTRRPGGYEYRGWTIERLAHNLWRATTPTGSRWSGTTADRQDFIARWQAADHIDWMEDHR